MPYGWRTYGQICFGKVADAIEWFAAIRMHPMGYIGCSVIRVVTVVWLSCFGTHERYRQITLLCTLTRKLTEISFEDRQLVRHPGIARGEADMHARKRQGLRVLIADNNAMTRHLLARALEQDSEFHVTECEFASPALTEAVQQAMPDILLVASGNNDSVEPVIAAGLQIPWILLLNHDDEEHIVAAFRSGARGIFLCSEPDLKLLRKCVRCVSKGQIWAASSQLKQVLAALPALQGPDVSRKLSSLRPLTRREQEVVSYVAEGLNNRDIAAAMNLRENTIKNYVFRVYEKLGLCNRVELTRYAMQRQARSS